MSASLSVRGVREPHTRLPVSPRATFSLTPTIITPTVRANDGVPENENEVGNNKKSKTKQKIKQGGSKIYSIIYFHLKYRGFFPGRVTVTAVARGSVCSVT